MPQVNIADMWVPPVWVKHTREAQNIHPSLINSGVCVATQQATEIASGPGLSATIPFFKDMTDQVDGIQVENTAPAIQGLGTGQMVCTILNRETANSASALSAAVSGASPVEEMTAFIGARRVKQRQATLLALLRGAFGSLGVAAGAGALGAMRLDNFDESGNDANPASQVMSADMFINACALMGEDDAVLENGAFWVHPNVYASLQKADKESFKEGALSRLPFKITTYRGVPIFKSRLLARVGTTNGFVYDSYILGPGIVAKGEKPQAGQRIDVASLQYKADEEKNNEAIFDRTRFVMHLHGMKWVGTPAGQSATNTELQTPANWQLVLSSTDRVGAVCIRTNG